MPITEWELTADVAAWMNEITGKDRTLPFSKVRCEQRPEGAANRRDLILLGGLGQTVVTGGMRLPYEKDGSSPYNAAFVNDARAKAIRVSSRYFFTWNVNECVLWETPPTRGPLKDQNYNSWNVAEILRESDLKDVLATETLKRWLPVFFRDLSGILQGTISIPEKSPDEKFLDLLESALRMPVLATLDELEDRCRKARDKSEIDKWVGAGGGSMVSDDPETLRANLQKAARFGCYGLLKKLLSHEVLSWRHGTRIDRIFVPGHIDTGADLRNHLGGYFSEAVRITGDYEAVFDEDRTAVDDRIPFLPDMAVPYWRELVEQIHEIDFSNLEFETIANIFERLTSQEERHKFSRLYTPAEEVHPTEDKTKRRSRGKVEQIASQVFEEIKSAGPQMLLRYDPDFLDRRKPFDTFELPAEGEPEPYQDLFRKRCVVFRKGKRRAVFVEAKIPVQDDLLILVAQSGIRGYVRFPHDEDECRRVLGEFSGFDAKRRKYIRELIESRSDDEGVREKVYAMVMQLIAKCG
jgi:hypothetical protein